jgi:hypothetical protein
MLLPYTQAIIWHCPPVFYLRRPAKTIRSATPSILSTYAVECTDLDYFSHIPVCFRLCWMVMRREWPVSTVSRRGRTATYCSREKFIPRAFIKLQHSTLHPSCSRAAAKATTEENNVASTGDSAIPATQWEPTCASAAACPPRFKNKINK